MHFKLWGFSRKTNGEITSGCLEIEDNHNVHKIILTIEELTELERQMKNFAFEVNQSKKEVVNN